jgi:hypothetical protein
MCEEKKRKKKKKKKNLLTIFHTAKSMQQSQHITSATFPASLKAVYTNECAEAAAPARL